MFESNFPVDKDHILSPCDEMWSGFQADGKILARLREKAAAFHDTTLKNVASLTTNWIRGYFGGGDKAVGYKSRNRRALLSRSQLKELRSYLMTRNSSIHCVSIPIYSSKVK
jgi:hypothetical protein